MDGARGQVVLYCIHEDDSAFSNHIGSYLHISLNPFPKFKILFKCKYLPITCRATHTSDSPSALDPALYTTQIAPCVQRYPFPSRRYPHPYACTLLSAIPRSPRKESPNNPSPTLPTLPYPTYPTLPYLPYPTLPSPKNSTLSSLPHPCNQHRTACIRSRTQPTPACVKHPHKPDTDLV
jgi:hypothetical protein